VRARLGWHRDETIVLHTGNMGLKQDLGNVIAAARLADERGAADVRFVLMGDGSQRKALEKAAEGVTTVQFLPPAPREQYTDVLAAADVLLVNERASSVDMCLPSKLTSYFRAGRPVIAASPSHGGTAAEVVDSGAGVVVPPGRPDVLLQAVAELSESSELSTLMGKLGLGYAEDQLDADRALGRLHRVLSAVATGASGAG
jgi:glycosyltransferase involved in cell wall biosynthesis